MCFGNPLKEDAAVSMLSYDKMKFFHSQLQSVPQHACLYQKGLHLGYMMTAYYYYLLSMQKVGENNHEEPNFQREEPKTNRVGTAPLLAINFS